MLELATLFKLSLKNQGKASFLKTVNEKLPVLVGEVHTYIPFQQGFMMTLRFLAISLELPPGTG